jgi:hypothetical protein
MPVYDDKGFIQPKIQPGQPIHTRQPVSDKTVDEETIVPPFISLGLTRLKESFDELARQAENRAKVVDEYNTSTLGVGEGNETVVTLFPTYDFMPEKIESIIATGPPAATVVIVLGDRQWNLVIPTSGVLVIAPVALMLSRTDTRSLTGGTAGQYTLELMGIADKRYKR